MNKEKLKTLALSPNSQNLFLALSIGEGLGMVEDVLEWWWESKVNLVKNWKGDVRCMIIRSNIIKISLLHRADGHLIVHINDVVLDGHELNYYPIGESGGFIKFIVENIKRYTLAYIFHLHKYGDQ